MFWICERMPATRDGVKRLGVVTLAEMVRALVAAVEIPRIDGRFIEVPQILTGSVPA